MEIDFAILCASVTAGAAPILLATLGETLTEKAGVVNLSLDGTILLSAMAAFVVAYNTRNVAAGFCVAALVGAAVAFLVALFSVYWGQNQVAVGFVLTLMTRDLAYFLGNSYSRLPGPQAQLMPISGLREIPFFGPVFFAHSMPVYLSLVMILFCYCHLYRTRWGRVARATGEHPAAVFARGFHPARLQLFYTVAGGLLVGLAGATFSLAVKPGWGRPQGCEGTGWIALALVIFGGWHPVRAALGAYLFAFLQVAGIYMQNRLPSVPAQVFQVAPFPLMIFTLLIISFLQRESVQRHMEQRPGWRAVLTILAGNAPAALGRPYRPE